MEPYGTEKKIRYILCCKGTLFLKASLDSHQPIFLIRSFPEKLLGSFENINIQISSGLRSCIIQKYNRFWAKRMF